MPFVDTTKPCDFDIKLRLNSASYDRHSLFAINLRVVKIQYFWLESWTLSYASNASVTMNLILSLLTLSDIIPRFQQASSRPLTLASWFHLARSFQQVSNKFLAIFQLVSIMFLASFQQISSQFLAIFKQGSSWLFLHQGLLGLL